MTCCAPGDDGAVILHGSEGTPASNDVTNTASQLIPDLVRVAAMTSNAPGYDGAVLLHCGEGARSTDHVMNTASQLGLHGRRSSRH